LRGVLRAITAILELLAVQSSVYRWKIASYEALPVKIVGQNKESSHTFKFGNLATAWPPTLHDLPLRICGAASHFDSTIQLTECLRPARHACGAYRQGVVRALIVWWNSQPPMTHLAGRRSSYPRWPIPAHSGARFAGALARGFWTAAMLSWRRARPCENSWRRCTACGPAGRQTAWVSA